jgi:hypothetical protein
LPLRGACCVPVAFNVSFQMSWPRKYFLALLPAAITVGGWQAALFAWDFFGCQGNLKNMQPCFAGSISLLPFMGLGLFWLQLASYVTVPVSIWMLISTGAKHFGSHNGASES